MATYKCEECQTTYASSRTFCPNCKCLSKDTKRYLTLLNQEISFLKSKLNSYRDKTFPCMECKQEISLYSTLWMFYDEKEVHMGKKGYIDDVGNISIYDKYATTKSLSCTYRSTCPHCKSEDPFNGKSKSFYISLNREPMSGFIVGLVKLSFVMAYRLFFALILAMITLLLIYQDAEFEEEHMLLAILPYLVLVSFFDNKMKKKIVFLNNYEKEIGDFYLNQRKDFEMSFGRINAASNFLPKKEQFRVDLRNQCLGYIHKFNEGVTVRVDENSYYMET